MKTQVIIERKSKKIIDVRQDKGSVHDFKMFKETIGKKVRPSIGIDAD
ncbi:MAG: IS5/IS1182 family transposase, partial [Spirochaetaceae bacterium]|nr:IS5/IS1182 family transposase [Spirochaetaceae bacterium]